MRTRSIVPLATMMALAACSDRQPTTASAADPITAPESSRSMLVTCNVDVARHSFDCVTGPESTSASPRSNVDGTATSPEQPSFDKTVGGQGTYVKLAQTSSSYAGSVLTSNVTLQNLTTQTMGSNGTTATGIKVFFHSGPTLTGGTGVVTVANPDGVGNFTGTAQPYFQYSGSLATGATSAAKGWQFALPGTVTAFSFQVYVYAAFPNEAANVLSAAPTISTISPSTLSAGGTATINGTNFSTTLANNTVSINGVNGTVTAATANQLTVTVPSSSSYACAATQNVGVTVTTSNMTSAAKQQPLAVANQRSLNAGESVIVTDATQVGCNELAQTGGKYVVAVYSNASSPTTLTSFELSGAAATANRLPAIPPVVADVGPAQSTFASAPPSPFLKQWLLEREQAERAHLKLLETNMDIMRRFKNSKYAPWNRPASEARRSVIAGPPPAVGSTRSLTIPSTNGTCNTAAATITGKVVYSGTRAVIYEDQANPILAAGSATLAAAYTTVGQAFDTDQYDIDKTTYGDPLKWDASLDNNSVLLMVFSNTINTVYPALSGFVYSCDFLANGGPGTSTSASNVGEVFYAMVPTSTTNDFSSSGTIPSWLASIRTTVIHEVKHIASIAARATSVPGNNGFDDLWIEEGTARIAEELWGRLVWGNTWKGNTGYGTPVGGGQGSNLYCEVRLSGFASCPSGGRKPAITLQAIFLTGGLYTTMQSPEDNSPFGRKNSSDFVFYGTGWSLVRYTIDRYASGTETAFLNALVNGPETGITNLAARAGVSIEQLLGGWALALYADDYPGMPTTNSDIKFPTFNLRSIYSGLNTDFGSGAGGFNADATGSPITKRAIAYGTVTTQSVSGLRGGSPSYFELSGTQSAKQLIKLTGTGGVALPSSIRVAIARLQ